MRDIICKNYVYGGIKMENKRKSEKLARFFMVACIVIALAVGLVTVFILSTKDKVDEQDYEELSRQYVSLESKFNELQAEYIEYKYFNSETVTKENNEEDSEEVKDDEISIIIPEFPIEVSYNSWGETKVTTRIDKVTYTYKPMYDGTCQLTLYYSGEKLYDTEGDEGLNPCHFDIILYDEDGNPVVRETGSGGWLKTGETFKDIDDLILDVPLGHNYTLAIVNYD